MMKLVDMSDLGSDEFFRGGSNPSIRKIRKIDKKYSVDCVNRRFEGNRDLNKISKRVCSLVGRALGF